MTPHRAKGNKEKEPVRIQRKRTKGWRMPENTVYVGRPSKWGNPFTYNGHKLKGFAVEWYAKILVEAYSKIPFITQNLQKELKGKNLACWCPLDKPCHADVLLKIANL